MNNYVALGIIYHSLKCLFVQILIEASMEGLVSELMDHISYVVLETARCLQSRTELQSVVKMSPMDVGHDANICNEFAEQLLTCTIGLPVPKVSVQI